MLEIYMLGDLKLFRDGELLKENLSHKGLALLSYLLINKEKSYSRDKLASLFWESSNDDAAKYNLRYTLWSLRKILRDNKSMTKFIITNKNVCHINPEADIYIDVFQMENLIAYDVDKDDKDYIDNLEKVKEIYRGEFLEGFYVKDCMEFNDWVFYERERLQRKYFRAMVKLAKAYKRKKQYFKSIEAYEEMLRINPLQEELYVELIKIYLEIGHIKSALNQYERCCKTLREELNISPGENIKKIYEEIIHKNDSKNDSNKNLDGQRRFLFFHNSELVGTGKEILRSLDKSTLRIDCYPVKNIPYYIVANIVEEIIDYYNTNLLKDIPQCFWRDLIRIQPDVIKIIGDFTHVDNLTCDTEKNRIFIALAKLLNEITVKDKLTLFITNFQWIDDISLEFLKYYLFKYNTENIKLIITWNNENERVKSFENLFKNQ